MKIKSETTIAINEAINAIEEYLQKFDVPLEGPQSWHQLNFFKNTLVKMLKIINKKILSDGEMFDGMGHIIIDSWPFNSSLGEKIVKAEKAFKKWQEMEE